MRRLLARDRRFGNNPGDAAVIPEDGDDLPPPPPRVARLLEAWERHLHRAAASQRISPVTARKYASVARAWGGWLGSQDVGTPTASDLRAFITWGDYQGWMVTTRDMYRSALRSLYRWAEATKRAPNIAKDLVREGRPATQDSPALEPTQISTLLATIPGNDLRAVRDRLIIAMLYGCALESISLVRACHRHVNLAARTFRHQPRAHRTADVVTHMPRTVARLYAAYVRLLHRPAPGDPLIVPVEPQTGRPVPGRSLSTLSIRLLVRRVLLVAYGDNPAVRGRPVPRRSGRARQRPASRVLRRSAVVNRAMRYGLGAAMAISRAKRPCVVRDAIAHSSPLA